PLFTTKKFGGTGLGLAVASQVVQQHQGDIYAESTLGEGTTFHILIPAAPAEAVAAPRQQMTPRRVRPAMRVTMIEDDESVGPGDQNLLTNAPSGKKVGYLQKPYESDELLAALDELLG